MNKTFTVDWTENKTSAKGANYMKASLTDEAGAKTENVTIFNNFPNFANIRPGEKISGYLKANEYNGKTSYSIDVARTASTTFVRGGAKTAQMNAAMEKKQENIERTLDRKDDAIRKAAIIRDSSLLTAAQIHGKNVPTAEIELYWKNWENFLSAQWDKPF